MRVLIPCKDTVDFDELNAKFGNIPDCKVFIVDECAICGMRGDAVLLSTRFSPQEFREVLMPMLMNSAIEARLSEQQDAMAAQILGCTVEELQTRRRKLNVKES